MTTRIRSLSLTTIALLLLASAPLHASQAGKTGSVDENVNVPDVGASPLKGG